MKNAAKITLASVLAATLSTAALAQESGGVSADVGVTAGTAGSVSGAAGAMNYGEVISSLRAGTEASAEIAAVEDASKVQVVLLSELRGNAAGNAQALDQALTAQSETVAEIRSEIEANETVNAKLEAEGYTAEDVVAVSSGADGEVTLIVEA